jgi:hypothetical protein
MKIKLLIAFACMAFLSSCNEDSVQPKKLEPTANNFNNSWPLAK